MRCCPNAPTYINMALEVGLFIEVFWIHNTFVYLQRAHVDKKVPISFSRFLFPFLCSLCPTHALENCCVNYRGRINNNSAKFHRNRVIAIKTSIAFPAFAPLSYVRSHAWPASNSSVIFIANGRIV